MLFCATAFHHFYPIEQKENEKHSTKAEKIQPAAQKRPDVFARAFAAVLQSLFLFLRGAADMQFIQLLLSAAPFSGLNGGPGDQDMLGGVNPPAQTQLR